MFYGDLAPEQQLFALQSRQRSYPAQMAHVDVGMRRAGDQLLAFASSQLESFVAADVNELGGEHRHDLAQVIADEIVSLRLGRAQNLTAVFLSQSGIAFLAQHVVKMSESLLLRNDLHMIPLGIVYQFGDLLRSDRAAVRIDRRMKFRAEEVLGINAVSVDFVFGEDAYLFLGIFQRRNRPAAPVVLLPAIAHGRDVAHGDRPDPIAAVGRIDQLAQRLNAVKHPGSRRGRDDYAPLVGQQHVAFRIGIGRESGLREPLVGRTAQARPCQRHGALDARARLFHIRPNADQLIGQRRGGEKVFFVAGAYPDGQSLAEIEITFTETYLGRIRDQRQPAVLERPARSDFRPDDRNRQYGRQQG